MYNDRPAIEMYGDEAAAHRYAEEDVTEADRWAEWQAAAALPLAAVPPETPDQAANAPQPQLEERRLVLPLLSLPQQQPPHAHGMPGEAPAISRDSAKQQQEPEKLNDQALHDIDALRRALLDEMGRLTSGDIATSLVGAIADAKVWYREAAGLGARSQRISTPTATRVYHSEVNSSEVASTNLPQRAA